MLSHPIARALGACLLAAWAGLPSVGSAQVIRCTDPVTGSVTYTDGECVKGQDRKEVAPRQTPEDIQRQYEQAHEALRLQREQQQAQAAQAPPSGPPPADRGAADPAQSAACLQARTELQGAMALDPLLYDTPARIATAQQNADLACLTPAEYARLQHRAGSRPIGVVPGYAPVLVIPPRPPHKPHRTERKPEMVQCNVFRCYDKRGNSYPR